MNEPKAGHHRTPRAGADETLVQLRIRPRQGEASASSHPHDAVSFEPTRRDFLSLVGFGLGAAGLAACRSPVQHAVPMTIASDQMVAGVANWFASTCGGCPSSCSIVVKQRDGRPIKVDGNEESTLFGRGSCATGQATVLSLYDEQRLRGPWWKGRAATWQEVDANVAASLQSALQGKGKVVLLSGTITSPTTRQIVADFAERFPGFQHVVYDPVSFAAIRIASARCFERPAVPHYSFDRARIIVGIDADFLGTWLSPVEFARQYGQARKQASPFLHVQCEAGLSLTGSNADIRLPLAPSDMGLFALALLRRIAGRAATVGVPDAPDPVDSAALDQIAERLWEHRGESLVVSGSNDVAIQVVVNALNIFLGNVGKTVDPSFPSLQRQGDDGSMLALVDQMNRGEVHTLLLYGVNPAYDFPDAERFLRGLDKVALSVSFSDRRDETSSRVHAICPDHHFLEAWGDAEPVLSHLGLAQPTIAPLFDTRSAAESLLRWTGRDVDHRSYLRGYWEAHIFSRQKQSESFDSFWDRSLERGVVVRPPKVAPPAATFQADWPWAARSIVDDSQKSRGARRPDRYELALYESVAMREGRHANNPWLQELPDPITKVTWGNFAAVSPSLARDLDVATGDVLSIETESGGIELPALVQPGQEARTISVALGYGRKLVGKAGRDVGVNAYPLARFSEGFRRYALSGVSVRKTGRHEPLARSQTHFSTEGRPIAETLDQSALALAMKTASAPGGAPPSPEPTLWAERTKGDHAWGMAIDLDACTGCSACVVACQAENNVPVVGKEQVHANRIMHWIRIDHYYQGPDDRPESVHQPMMCQHCQNAPCETVCPVLATTTSSEGLNQQVYNRCIGTRYCANNCPYKVRRFNWFDFGDPSRFDFNRANPIGRMVLNPDVTVRSRGVMEKCSLCVQRIQSSKNDALKKRRPLADGDIATACEQACPTQAIVFGDLKDPKSRVALLSRDERNYEVLEELGTRPNVSYLKKVRRARGA